MLRGIFACYEEEINTGWCCVQKKSLRFVFLNKCHEGYQIEESEMDGACSRRGREAKIM
jgi:hypothetical protein